MLIQFWDEIKGTTGESVMLLKQFCWYCLAPLVFLKGSMLYGQMYVDTWILNNLFPDKTMYINIDLFQFKQPKPFWDGFLIDIVAWLWESILQQDHYTNLSVFQFIPKVFSGV